MPSPDCWGTTASDDALDSYYLLHAPYVLNNGPFFFLLNVQVDYSIFSYQYSNVPGRLLLLVSPKQKAAALGVDVMGFKARALVEEIPVFSSRAGGRTHPRARRC